MALTVIEPTGLTDATLVASNVPETDYAAWASGTTYALGARVIRTSTHSIYESLQASNTGNTPESEPTWWIRVGPTNRWRAWDTSSSTQTSQAGTITYQVSAARSASVVALINVAAVSVTVRVETATATVVYEETVPVTSELTESTWWSYFFQPTVTLRDVVLQDVPIAPGYQVFLTVDGGTGTAAVGAIVIGQANTIGEGVQYGALTGIRDYSVKQVNDFGDTVLVQRAFSKRASFRMWVSHDSADAVQDRLTALRAVPALWIGVPDSGYARTIVFGYYRDFEMLIAYPTYSELSIDLEGLT